MKKFYEKPFAEKIEFDYNDQVVAASGCTKTWTHEGSASCNDER